MSLPRLGPTPLLLIPRPRTLARRRKEDAPERFDAKIVEELTAWSNLSFRDFRPVSGASRGDNVIAETKSGRLLIKRYKHTVSASMIEHEHSVLQRLDSVGFPAPRLVAAPHDQTFVEISGRHYAIFVYEAGYFHYHEYIWPHKRYLRFVSQSGQALAALHDALSGFRPAGSNPNGIDPTTGNRLRDVPWHLERLTRVSQAAPGLRGDGSEDLRAILETSAAHIEDRLLLLDKELERVEPPIDVIHGDFGPYNLMFRRGEPPLVLDFEMARVDWTITDLAKSFQQFGLTRRGPRLDRMAALLTGYRTQRPLSDTEVLLIPIVWEFLSLRRAIVCLAEFGSGGRAERLTEAKKKLELASMIRGSSQAISELAEDGQAPLDPWPPV